MVGRGQSRGNLGGFCNYLGMKRGQLPVWSKFVAVQEIRSVQFLDTLLKVLDILVKFLDILLKGQTPNL